jgi:hypothetical protein
MRRRIVLILLFEALLVFGFAWGLRARRFPLGVPGEWEWPRIAAHPDAAALFLAGLVLVFHAGFAAIGMRTISRHRRTVPLWLGGLVVAAVGIQLSIQEAAPPGYGLTKWVTLELHGSSGYFGEAKKVVRDPRAFWRNYPQWIARQGVLHLGTHPPGLILASALVKRSVDEHPDIARRIDANLPRSFVQGYATIVGGRDRQAVAVLGVATLIGCSLTVLPLYALVRSRFPSEIAWTAAALWPVVPSAILFQPTADTWFPLLSTTALALASRGRSWSAILAGVVLAVGMQFSLVFLAVGLIVAVVLMLDGDLVAPGPLPLTWRRRAGFIAATGAGFVATTLLFWGIARANPFVIWWWNAQNHARFYQQFHRSYLAWVVVNPIETAVALGWPCTVWAVLGLWRTGPAVAWATAFVLVVLTLGGRNLSEVARLWLPFFPMLLAASAAGMARLKAGPGALAATVILLGIQALALQAMIQVVYPV